MRVNCGKQLYSALTRDRVANFLRSSLLISYWLRGFVFVSLLEVWIELLKHCGRSSGLSLKSIIELFLFKKISLQLCQVELIQTGNKQNLQLIKWKKIHLFLIEWQELFQLQVNLQFIWLTKHLETYIMNVLMREKNGNFQLQICYIR